MKALRPLSRRRLAFARGYVASGGNARLAALQAGYAQSGAHVVGHDLLRNQDVLGLILSFIHQGAPGGAETLKKLTKPTRSKSIRLLVDVLVAAGDFPKIIGTDARPYVLGNHADEIAGRGAVARLASEYLK